MNLSHKCDESEISPVLRSPHGRRMEIFQRDKHATRQPESFNELPRTYVRGLLEFKLRLS
jgi:hypothetical protein